MFFWKWGTDTKAAVVVVGDRGSQRRSKVSVEERNRTKTKKENTKSVRPFHREKLGEQKRRDLCDRLWLRPERRETWVGKER